MFLNNPTFAWTKEDGLCHVVCIKRHFLVFSDIVSHFMRADAFAVESVFTCASM